MFHQRSPHVKSTSIFNMNFVAKPKNKQKGFTLVEIMIVLVILGGLFAVLSRGVFGQKDKANQNMAKITISKIASAVEMFYNDCDQYPQDLNQLVTKPSEDVCENWQPKGYVSPKDLKDPWKREYVYEVEGGGFIVRSLGKDGQPDGEGYDKDISSEDL